jgi:hypothetical protein
MEFCFKISKKVCLTSRYNFLSKTPSYFSIHFACFSKTNKTLEVTGINHFVSSSDGEAIAEPLYRELDNPVLLLDTFCLFFQNKQNTRSDIYHFVSSSDFMGFERNLMKSYRELDKPILLLDTSA